jgi:HEPN domain-containing protein
LKSTAETYRSAAAEHLASAQWLYDQERYYLSHYLSGLAVECILRAYLRRSARDFDARHDIQVLASQARFFDLIPYELHEQFGAALSAVNLRWRSTQRYMSERELWSYLSSVRADFDRKGNRRKINSRTMLNLAYEIVRLGDRRWPSNKQASQSR